MLMEELNSSQHPEPKKHNLLSSILARFITLSVLGQRPQTAELMRKDDVLYAHESQNPDNKKIIKVSVKHFQV
jgi:hypothetical protein